MTLQKVEKIKCAADKNGLKSLYVAGFPLDLENESTPRKPGNIMEFRKFYKYGKMT